MAMDINNAISVIAYFNNHNDAWRRLEAISLKNCAEYKNGYNSSLIKFPFDNLIEVQKIVAQYEEWKAHLKKLDVDFAKTFSADWVPITDNFIVDMAFIDLSKEELPLLLLGCKSEYYIKIACSSLLQFIADYEEDKRNHSLSLVTDSYIEFVENIADTLDQRDDLNIFFSKLPDLWLDENYELDDFRSRDLDNSVLWLYPRHKSLKGCTDSDFHNYGNDFWQVPGISRKERKVLVPLKIGSITLLKYRKVIKPNMQDVLFWYITVPLTEVGIWQAYLLKQTYHLIGMRWHGGYEKRIFINTYENIKNVLVHGNGEKVRDRIRKQWNSDMLPSVVLDENYAYITHCWFDEWKGFVQMKWKVIYDIDMKQICEFHLESEKVLVGYNCGIIY